MITTMFYKSQSQNGRLIKKRWLFILKSLLVAISLLPFQSFAHPSPNTLIFLDIRPGKIQMEVKLPLPELELAFGHDIGKNPGKIIEQFSPQLKEYIVAHVHAYATKDRPWKVFIADLKMDKGNYEGTNLVYWEVSASITLQPQAGDDVRHFFLDYDVIIHQVVNHAALVSIRSDWENGNIEGETSQAQVIAWNLQDNNIPPLQINLEQGSWWKGFKSMLQLGMAHIKEGTDHLLFLLVLLLPAPLLVQRKLWSNYGGSKYSVIRILKIVTAFTIGHSITLLLGSLGWVRLPSQPVEILIAVSILVSAVHAIKPIFPGKEIYVAGGFGLVHGLAFASTLSNLNLDAGPMALSILGFNIGIELMQLFVIATSFPWLIVLSRTKGYAILRVVGAVLAGVAAIAWIVERITNEENFLITGIETVALQAKWIVAGIAILAIASLVFRQSKIRRVT